MEIAGLFLDCLKNLVNSQDFDTKIFPFDLVTYGLTYRLGVAPELGEDHSLDLLESRISALINEHGFDEEFLVLSLIDQVRRDLSSILESHGKSILFNEHLLQKAKEDGIDMDVIQESLDRLKDRRFYIYAKKALEKWNLLICQNLSPLTIQTLSDKKLLAMSDGIQN